ncbi:hypothetical protein BP00DRAFT_352593, partial [Aspergillus indologenus CBS 114.80]
AHTTTGCGKQGFPSAQPYLSHTPGANPFCCMFLLTLNPIPFYWSDKANAAPFTSSSTSPLPTASSPSFKAHLARSFLYVQFSFWSDSVMYWVLYAGVGRKFRLAMPERDLSTEG